MVDHRSDASDDDASVDVDAYVDACADDEDNVMVVDPYQSLRPSSVENVHVVMDGQVAVLIVDPYCAFSYNVVVVDDEDAVALDQTWAACLSKIVVDHQDVEPSFQGVPFHDVGASFYTYADAVVVHCRHDVD